MDLFIRQSTQKKIVKKKYNKAISHIGDLNLDKLSEIEKRNNLNLKEAERINLELTKLIKDVNVDTKQRQLNLLEEQLELIRMRFP